MIRSYVLREIAPDSVRCLGCDYMLRGIENDRCPECGQEFDVQGQRELRFSWEGARVHRKFTYSWFRTAGISLLLAAPFVWYGAMMLLPLPVVATANREVARFRRTLESEGRCLPLRLDSAYAVGTDASVGMISFEKHAEGFGAFAAQWWRARSDVGVAPPDATTTGVVGGVDNAWVIVGPWRFRWSIASQSAIWLCLPNRSFELSVGADSRS